MKVTQDTKRIALPQLVKVGVEMGIKSLNGDSIARTPIAEIECLHHYRLNVCDVIGAKGVQ